MLRRIVSLALLVCFAVTPAAWAEDEEERSSKNDERLARVLERNPAADANKDGVLTQSEFDAFRKKLRAARSKRRGGTLPKPTHADVKYGPHARNVLDVWLVRNDTPTPAVVYIHGGGFVAGRKGSLSPSVLKKCMDANISVAAIHYRFVTTDIFPAPQHDGARAIQFLRTKAKDWNFDPKRFAAYGGSAGAGISLWLGFHDDLAKPESKDPVERASSRVTAVGSIGGQSSYDPEVIKAWIGGKAHLHPSMFKIYGVTSEDELKEPRVRALCDECSAIKHLSKGDAPVIMFYSERDAPLPENARPGQGIHHPIFGHKLKAEMDKLGIEAVYHHVREKRVDQAAEMVAFFRKQFELVGKAPTTGD